MPRISGIDRLPGYLGEIRLAGVEGANEAKEMLSRGGQHFVFDTRHAELGRGTQCAAP